MINCGMLSAPFWDINAPTTRESCRARFEKQDISAAGDFFQVNPVEASFSCDGCRVRLTLLLTTRVRESYRALHLRHCEI